MVRNIIEWSVKFRRIVLAAALGVIVLGAFQLDELKTDVLPEFGPVTVEVQTEALGLSAAEVERLITIPLEQDLLSGVAFLERMESASLPGVSSVVMTFEPGTDPLDARQVVGERLVQAAALPQVAGRPQMLQPLSATGRVAMVSLSSDELTPIETSVLARWVIVPRLLGVEGVANVSIWGFRDRQLQVLIDPETLDEQGVTISQVIRTTGNALEVSPLTFLEASSPGTGGFIDTVNQRLHVFHEQAISTPEELAKVPLEDNQGGAVIVGGEPLTLGDVSNIVSDHQPLIGDAFCNDGPCVMLVIEKFPNANTPEVTADVEAALEALAPGLGDVQIDSSIYRPATFIENSFGNLRTMLLTGGVLALLVMGAFLMHWRGVVVTVVSIAVSLAGAGLVLFLMDVTVNGMTLAGLVLALLVVVDDSIVGAWGLGHHRLGDQSADEAITNTAFRTRSAALYAAVIVGAAALTFFFLAGQAGAFLPHIASAYLVGLAVAIVISLTVTPALSALLREGGRAAPADSSVVRSLRSRYVNLAPRLVTKWMGSAMALVLLVGAALVALPLLDSSFRPDLKQRDVLIEIEAPPGTSLSNMDAVAAGVISSVGALDGIANVGAHVGRAIKSDQVVNVNSAEVWATIDESANYEGAVASIEQAAAAESEYPTRVSTYSDQRVTEILGRTSDELILRVYGVDSGVLEEVAGRVRDSVDGVRGLSDVRVDLPAQQSTIEVEVDLDRAQAVGLKPGDVRRHATTMLSGVVVGNLFEDQKVFDVLVWGEPGLRESVEDVREMFIPTPVGVNVTLAEVADVRVVPNVAVIKHESVSTYVDVIATLGSRDVAALLADIDVALDDVAFPIEYHAEVLGGFTAEAEAKSRTMSVVVAALIGMFVVLQAAFGSWRLAILVFATLPVVPAGGVLAIAITGGEVTLGAVAALLGLAGLAARFTILLVHGYQDRERSGEPFGSDLIVGVTSELLAPTLAPVAGLAVLFAPLAFAGSRAGLETVGPMAIVVLGGLAALALYSTVFLPAFYLRWGFVKEPDTVGQDLGDLFTSASSDLVTGGD